MEIGLGHRYKAAINGVVLQTAPSAYDLILVAPAANVPVIVDRIVATASVLAGTILPLVLTRRSTASTGAVTGGGTIVPTPSSPASPAASSTVSYLIGNTAVGTVSGTPLDAQQWNEFAPYEFNVRPGGELIVPGSYLALYVPVAPPSTVTASFTVEFIELK